VNVLLQLNIDTSVAAEIEHAVAMLSAVRGSGGVGSLLTSREASSGGGVGTSAVGPPIISVVSSGGTSGISAPAPAPASETEALFAMQAAVARGVQLPAIVAILAARGVQRVNQLDADGRASFVAAIGALGGGVS
jgi:hypothetical protein